MYGDYEYTGLTVMMAASSHKIIVAHTTAASSGELSTCMRCSKPYKFVASSMHACMHMQTKVA